jgi:hypothetical protein
MRVCPVPVGVQGRVGAEDGEEYLTFVGLGAGQRESDRWPVQGGDQM